MSSLRFCSKIVIYATLLSIFFSLHALFINATCHAAKSHPSSAKPEIFLTDEERQWLDGHTGRVKLAPAPDWEPMEFFDGDGNYRGMVADYIRLIEKKLDFKFDIVRVESWEKVVALSQKAKIDVISAAMATKERQRFMIWTTPYIHLKTNIIVNKSFKGNSTLEKMEGMRIGVPKAYVVGEFIREKYPQLTLVDVLNGIEGMQKVSFGELDAMIMEVPNALHVIETEKITNLRLAGDTGFELHHGIGIRKDWPILAAILEKTLANISESEHREITERWIRLETTPFYRTEAFRNIVTGIAIFVLVVTGSILIWNRTLKREVKQRTLELKRNESRLEAALKNVKNMIEYSPNGIVIMQNGKVVYRNAKQLELIGEIEPREVVGYDHIYSEDRSNVKRFYKGLMEGNPTMTEIDFRFYSSLTKRTKETMKWVTCLVAPIDYKDGKGFLLTTIDRTRARELEHLLTVQDKMASLGRVAAGIGHEIRNPLSGINIYLRTLEKGVNNPAKSHKVAPAIDAIRTASGKMEAVIKRVMDFSRPTEPQFALIEINRPIRDAIQLAKMSLKKKRIALEVSLADNLPNCYAEPHLIEEVILNLINNAVDALGEQTTDKQIRVTSKIEMESGNILITVDDSGPGIDGDLAEKIFEPFFTTKAFSTGIGLSLCHRIITDHWGEISAENGELGGAKLTITLPYGDLRPKGIDS